MVDFLHGLHSGIRYLVLLAAVVTLVIAALGMSRTTSLSAAGRTAMSIFAGLLDLQVLLGVLLLLTWPFYGALIGHIVMMVLAAAVVHGGSVLARRRAPDRSAASVRLVTAVLALVLIVGGIMAIQRPIL